MPLSTAIRSVRSVRTAKRSRGSREVINPQEAGYAVTHRTPQEIADAVVRLLTLNDDWHTHSGAARARYEREFTAAHFRERIVNALRAAVR